MEKICLCIECKNYTGDWKCKAYPDNIPNDIIFGNKIHDKYFGDDSGFMFVPVDQKAQELFDMIKEK